VGRAWADLVVNPVDFVVNRVGLPNDVAYSMLFLMLKIGLHL
jgi:hypothetical protein